MAFGEKDARGIYHLGEDDTTPSFSQTMRLVTDPMSDALKYFADTAAKRAALTPAPPGALWQDTDGDGTLWSAGPSGDWRRHEGAVRIPSGTGTASGALYSRVVSLTIPTVISAKESIDVSTLKYAAAALFANVADITRGPTSTTVDVRVTATSATPGSVDISWRILRAGL